MEIELPDGTVLDAPDDADVKKVVQGYRRKQTLASNPSEYDPNSPEFKAKYGAESTAMQAFASGGRRVNAGLGNMARKYAPYTPMGMVAKQFDYTSDDALKEQDAIDQQIKERHPVARAGGEIGAGMLATGPAAAIGGPLEGAGVVGRTLLHPALRAGLEGATQGAAVSDPDHQGTGAARGAVLSMAVNRLLAGGGKLLKGVIDKSEAYKALQQLAAQQGEEIFAPISQAASDSGIINRGAKVLYGEGLSLVPGVKGQLNRQAKGAEEKVRELALKEATPQGVKLPGNPGQDVQESLASVNQGFKEAMDDTVGKVTYRIPANTRSALVSRVKSANKNVDDTTLDKVLLTTRGLFQRFGKGKTIEGANLVVVRDELKRLADKAPAYEQAAFKAAHEGVDDLIRSGLSKDQLARYADLEEPSRHLLGLTAAAKSAVPNSGRFTPGQLARNAKDPTQLDLAQTANEVLSQSPSGTSFAGRSLAGGAGLAGLGATAGLPAAGTALVGANLLATKTAQKALMGDTAAQKALVELLKAHPEAADTVRKALQTAAANQGGE